MFPAKLFQHLAPRAQNTRWPPDLVGGMANFFPIALRTKIFVARVGFSSTRNALNTFSKLSSRYFG